MGKRYIVRPLGPWTGPARPRRPSPFSAPWSNTMDLLDRELRALGVRNTWILQIDVSEAQVGRDGADATPASPAVKVACESSSHGPLTFSCDRFTDWHANLRAIALGLEALRRADRYGVANRGEQYRGFVALPVREHEMSREQAAEFIAHWSGGLYPAETIIHDRDALTAGYRVAARRVHPDLTGDGGDTMTRLNAARDLLINPAA